MEEIKSNGEGCMDFNVTLSFDAKFDTKLGMLDGEHIPLRSISIV